MSASHSKRTLVREGVLCANLDWTHNLTSILSIARAMANSSGHTKLSRERTGDGC
jgi:hypothetical protein